MRDVVKNGCFSAQTRFLALQKRKSEVRSRPELGGVSTTESYSVSYQNYSFLMHSSLKLFSQVETTKNNSSSAQSRSRAFQWYPGHLTTPSELGGVSGTRSYREMHKNLPFFEMMDPSQPRHVQHPTNTIMQEVNIGDANGHTVSPSTEC